jgi:hypothetical protein
MSSASHFFMNISSPDKELGVFRYFVRWSFSFGFGEELRLTHK